jgi:putative membrane protein
MARQRDAEESTMMYSHGDHMNGWGYALGSISMVLFWGLLVLAMAAAVRYLGRERHARFSPGPPAPPSTPEQVLAERLARGDIGTDEYRERLETLRQAGRTAATETRG